jgi:hypothetical protein
VQEGTVNDFILRGSIIYPGFPAFNMGNDLALLVTYAAMLVDGNQLTNLLSIGGKTTRTGKSPPPPAIVGGLDTHGVFEGLLFVFYSWTLAYQNGSN